MKNKLMTLLIVIALSTVTDAGIYDFKGGTRIPAGSCSVYSNTPKVEVVSTSGGLSIFNMSGPIEVITVCQLPVPEKVRIRQFVMVGNVGKGLISAELGGVRWNAPRQHIRYAEIKMLPSTPFEAPEMKQKKVVVNLPSTGTGSLTTDRIQSYFIGATFSSPSPLTIEQALELFYFEVYWD